MGKTKIIAGWAEQKRVPYTIYTKQTHTTFFCFSNESRNQQLVIDNNTYEVYYQVPGYDTQHIGRAAILGGRLAPDMI